MVRILLIFIKNSVFICFSDKKIKKQIQKQFSNASRKTDEQGYFQVILILDRKVAEVIYYLPFRIIKGNAEDNSLYFGWEFISLSKSFVSIHCKPQNCCSSILFKIFWCKYCGNFKDGWNIQTNIFSWRRRLSWINGWTLGRTLGRKLRRTLRRTLSRRLSWSLNWRFLCSFTYSGFCSSVPKFSCGS